MPNIFTKSVEVYIGFSKSIKVTVKTDKKEDGKTQVPVKIQSAFFVLKKNANDVENILAKSSDDALAIELFSPNEGIYFIHLNGNDTLLKEGDYVGGSYVIDTDGNKHVAIDSLVFTFSRAVCSPI